MPPTAFSFQTISYISVSWMRASAGASSSCRQVRSRGASASFVNGRMFMGPMRVEPTWRTVLLSSGTERLRPVEVSVSVLVLESRSQTMYRELSLKIFTGGLLETHIC